MKNDNKAQQKEILWQTLQNAAERMKQTHLRELFKQDPSRASKFSLTMDEIHLDYSKNLLTTETIATLLELAQVCEVPSAIKALLSGEHINTTENRPALHSALRQDSSQTLNVKGQNVLPLIRAEKEKMYRIVEQLHQGIYKGATGEKITDVVNLGIGGSDLGPVMAVEALKNYQQTAIRLHFVSNVDPDAITNVLKELNPATTLFIVSSKSFSTPETLMNAKVAKNWLQENLKTEKIINQFIGVTANAAKAQEFGLLPENILNFWDWVGGRYSIWSTIGLPLAISIGVEHFEEFLLGARRMDEHFANSPLSENMPVLLALIGIWYINFWNAHTIAVLPYSSLLSYFADYLQQLDMESNGKQVQHSGESVDYLTGPIVWGQPGTNGQHAFYQLLHQGTHFIPIDFIVAAQTHTEQLASQHLQLVANCLAQSAALMQGTPSDVKSTHDKMPGNKPSNTLLLSKISPRALGQLLALYEHKVFVQGAIWQINSFDQPGVELGKKLASTFIASLENGKMSEEIDHSTRTLIEKIRQF
ncbi:MAG: glucose-6-phosphate isomerase [Gammaproteobacteria bacterium 39-13]|nr:glucose-6-phosphate isomerase [Gammaproteobacteria bacterium]OJV88091.1 MAG: glucose-6-phosphate isomerase [Gammaproteobacteria bacterium 39-13]